ncbi:unnamed protein product [Coffea canephora]|uniref:Uncharacterized protein n=2 Tax=Coffea TaxID=13442 RepID=A0A068TU78_COFCA|nr:uncharacterized protein LOC113725721 [Coffea arabica]CDO99845.1 unnamed protein product [Coffea canephora]
MADAAARASDDQPNDNPILSFFSNFVKLLNLPPLPFLPPAPASKTKQPEEPANGAGPVAVADSAAETKPSVVKFGRPSEATLPSVKLEADEVEERNTNPVVLWQVYAIGGLLVLRWAWTRWNERKERKKPSDEDRPPAVE